MFYYYDTDQGGIDAVITDDEIIVYNENLLHYKSIQFMQFSN